MTLWLAVSMIHSQPGPPAARSCGPSALTTTSLTFSSTAIRPPRPSTPTLIGCSRQSAGLRSSAVSR